MIKVQRGLADTKQLGLADLLSHLEFCCSGPRR